MPLNVCVYDRPLQTYTINLISDEKPHKLLALEQMGRGRWVNSISACNVLLRQQIIAKHNTKLTLWGWDKMATNLQV